MKFGEGNVRRTRRKGTKNSDIKFRAGVDPATFRL